MQVKVVNNVLTIRGFAELSAANDELFRQRFCTDLNGYTSIEIDLSRTTFMDCTGLGALIALRKLAHARNGAVRLVNPTPAVQGLFDVMRAGEIFEIVNTRPTKRPQENIPERVNTA